MTRRLLLACSVGAALLAATGTATAQPPATTRVTQPLPPTTRGAEGVARTPEKARPEPKVHVTVPDLARANERGEVEVVARVEFPETTLEERLRSAAFTIRLESVTTAADEERWDAVSLPSCAKGLCDEPLVPPERGAVTKTYRVRLQRNRTAFRVVLRRGGAQPREILSSRVEVPFAPAPRVFVLAIGISKYKETEKRVPNLCYPANDARAIRAYFESVRLTAYSGKEELLRSLRQVEVKDLVDKKATKQGMLDTFADMLERTTHQDTVILVFSGHGVRGPVIEDPLYLIPHDGEFTGNWWRFHQRNLALSELLRPFRLSVWKGGARRLLMIIDTCYSGAALVEKELDARVGAEVAIIASALPYQKAKDSPDGRCLLQPYGDRDRGFFAKILLGALRGRGDGPAVEEAGGVKAISMYGLMDHVRRGMMKETQDQRPMGIGRFQGWLLPVIP